MEKPTSLRIALLLVALALIGAATLLFPGQLNDDAVPEKPEWWPDESYTPWPPPKPEDWTKPWPPTEDLQWWVEYFSGLDGDWGGDPDNPIDDGDEGDFVFPWGFTSIDDVKRPNCGIFTLARSESTSPVACQPYPSAVVTNLCKKARDSHAATAACRVACNSQPKCRTAFLMEPPIHVLWLCMDDIAPGEASCDAEFLCQCLEI